ncbi:MAG: glycosyltransferase [Deltaproteobacteria bacterium]|nr:glycosyltransferase [Deltaproteobacteria bacterium]
MALRVAFFTPTLASGGADRVTITLLHHLDRTRFEPTLILLRREGALVGELPTHVRTITLGSRRLAVAVPALARVLRTEAPDVVFAMQGGANIVAAIAHVLARSRARLVISERSALRRPDRSAARTALELPAKRATYRRADVVTAVSRGVAQALETELGLARAKIHVVYNPMVDDGVRALAAERIDHPWFAADVPVVVALGRLVAIKDYPTMLAAFAAVRARRPARLFVLGEGPLRPGLEREARELGIAEDVRFHGFDPNPFKYLARAAALVHTSRAEGLPGGIIQAMACGVPVIATDADFGPREVITDRRDGYLVPVGDVAAIADRLERVLADRALARSLGTAAEVSARRFDTATALARYQGAMLGEPAAW